MVFAGSRLVSSTLAPVALAGCHVATGQHPGMAGQGRAAV
jgi:hypothetical protein